MGLTPLIPLAGVAVGSLAIAAAKRLQDGPLFADVFRSASRTEAAPKTTRESPGKPDGNDLPAAWLDRWQRESLPLLARYGVDVQQPLDLQIDDAGEVTFGNHPDQAVLQQLFAEQPRFLELARELASAVRRQRERELPGFAASRVGLSLRSGAWQVR